MTGETQEQVFHVEDSKIDQLRMLRDNIFSSATRLNNDAGLLDLYHYLRNWLDEIEGLHDDGPEPGADPEQE